MINVNEVKQYAEWLAKKWQSGAIFSPDQFNLVLPNVVRSLVRKYYGVPEEYQVGNPMPRIAADQTQLVRDYLGLLRPTTNITLTQGVGDLPLDYIHKSTAVYDHIEVVKVNKVLEQAQAEDCPCDDDTTMQKPASEVKNNETIIKTVPIMFLTDEMFDWSVASTTRKPTLQYPIARMVSGTGTLQRIEVAPKEIKSIRLTYYRYPKKPFWNYTTAGGFSTFNPVGSQNIELPEICAEEVVLMCLQRMGISIREPMLINWAEKQRQQGS